MDFNLKIVEDKENKLIERREIQFIVEHLGNPTPSRLDIRAKLAAILDVNPETLFVIKTETEYGIGRTRGLAHIYETLERAMAIESKYIIERHQPKKKEEEE